MKYIVKFRGYMPPHPRFDTLTQARKFLNECKRDCKNESRHTLKDEHQHDKNSYKLVFGCNIYSEASIITLDEP